MQDIPADLTDVDITVDVVKLNVEAEAPPAIAVDVDFTSVEVLTEPPSPVSVDVEIVGQPGPKGDRGDKGPPGPPGIGAMSRFTHTQSMLSPTWVVQHNLGCHPTVITEDAVGNVLYGSITYIDNDTLIVGFAYSITGVATCL